MNDYTGDEGISIDSRPEIGNNTNHLTKNEENGDTNYGNP